MEFHGARFKRFHFTHREIEHHGLFHPFVDLPAVGRWLGDTQRASVDGELPWHLLGIHSTRLLGNRDEDQDEALGLNCTWYADILMTLTE